MFCRKCGAKIPDDSQFCVKCGVGVVGPNTSSTSHTGTAVAAAPALESSIPAKPLNESSEPSAASASPVATSSTADPLKGIRGWLLLFCLGIVFVQPLALIVGSDSDFEAVFALLLGAFSVYTGICLWRVRHDALRLVKAYFIVVLFLAVLAIAEGFMTATATRASEPPSPDNILATGVRMLIGVAIWWSYFKKSKRVKATYGANL